MSDSRPQWMLKVIAGPHQGAEIELASGKTLIGSDDGCDVVLHDVLIAPQHLAVESGAKGFHVEPLGGRVYLGGKRVRETRQKVEPFIFITIGGTHLVIGPMEGKWPLLSAADAPELEKEAPEPPPEEEKPEAAAASEKGPASPDAAPATAASPATGPTGFSTRDRRLGAIFGVTMGVLLLAGWVVVFSVWKNNHPRPDDDRLSRAEENLMSRAEQVLEMNGAAGIVRVENNSGRLYARGYVPRNDQLREIEVGLREQAPGVNPRIWSLETILDRARSIIRNQKLELQAEATPEGRLVVTGRPPDRETWDRVRLQLQDEIPGVSGVDGKVQLPSPVPVPAPAPQPKVIIVQAPAPPASEPASPPAAPLPAAPAPAPAPAAAPPLLAPRPLFPTIDTPEATVEAITPRAAGLGWMRLSSGGVYFAGARLPYGGMVLAISEGKVTLQDGDARRDVSMGGKVFQPAAGNPQTAQGGPDSSTTLP